ncbi:uncharacterized protein J3D65DRAFT_353655 [Phyllosticta citribraziliensis]|uniref:Uncharacterized protein n=1 Tax=Phyllosticta citribraziliensis TaxID=989973 RepID=A0ABR1LRZ6_9PEZI
MEGRPCFSSAPHLDYANEFLVKWRDAQTGHTMFLGQLAFSGRRCGELSMWFADDADEKCMIGLSLPLKMRVASKKRRDVHLILPARSFASLDNLFSIDVVTAQDDPEAAHEFRRAGLGSSTKVLRLSFALQEHGYAMMPTEPFKNPLPSNSRGLLLSLRSLSRSTAFEVYLPYLESAADLLERFATKARSVPVDSPSIDHVKTYSGRSWGVDEWAVYGIEDKEAMPNAWNPVVDDDPPPYEEAVREKSNHPGNSTQEHPENSPNPSQVELRQHLKLLVEQEQARLHATNGDNGSIPDTASWIWSDHSETPSPPAKRKAEALQLESEQPHKCRPIEKPDADNGRNPRHADGEARPFKLERNALHNTEDEVFISRRSLLNGGPSRTLFSDAQYRCFTIALNWFMTIWQERADAHIAFLPELKRLAQLASEADSRQQETLKRFEDFRVECMHLFCQDDRPLRQTPFRHDLSMEEKLRLVHQFVYRPDAALPPGRDCYVLDDLLALHEAAKACSSHLETRRELEFAFYAQMSTCVLLVLYGTAHGNE